MNHIKVNTGRLNTDIGYIGSLLRSMKAELERMKENVKQMDRMWDGPTSEAFKKVFWDDMSAMDTMIKNLESIYSYEQYAKKKYESCENKVGGIVAKIRV